MDYDLDGLLDIFAANGHVADDISVLQPTLKYEEVPLTFRNKGNGKFEDVTGRLGPALRRAVVGRGAAARRTSTSTAISICCLPPTMVRRVSCATITPIRTTCFA